MKNITLITARSGLSFELVPKPVHAADLGPQIVVHDGDFRIASYCLSTFRENVAKKQGVCITAGKFEKYRAIESDTLAELVAEADALLSGAPPPPASQGAPELLAALERLANAVDAHCRSISTAALIELDDATINARAAIAKATGGAK
jgi:hypothetical protein